MTGDRCDDRAPATEPGSTDRPGHRAPRRVGDRLALGRRSLLAALGAAATGPVFSVAAAAAEYGTIVDVVDEGADPTGVESVTPVLYVCVCKTRHHPVLVNGDGAWIEANYLESYDDYGAVRLDESASNATIRENTLVNGVLDTGSSGPRMYGNDVR